MTEIEARSVQDRLLKKQKTQRSEGRSADGGFRAGRRCWPCRAGVPSRDGTAGWAGRCGRRRTEEGLLAATRQANVHTTRDRLRAAVPNTSTLFERLAERGEALRPHVTRLLALLDDYGPEELAAAVDIALQRDAFGAGSITHILETRRRQRRLKPPLRLTLPDRPGLRDLDVQPHDLETYDALGQRAPDDAG